MNSHKIILFPFRKLSITQIRKIHTNKNNFYNNYSDKIGSLLGGIIGGIIAYIYMKKKPLKKYEKY